MFALKNAVTGATIVDGLPDLPAAQEAYRRAKPHCITAELVIERTARG